MAGMSAEKPIDGPAATKDMPAVEPRPVSQPPDRRDRRVYVWWGAGLSLLALLAVFCWFLLRPYLEVRAAAKRVMAGATAPTEVQTLGGPEEAAAKCGFYLRLPVRIAPDVRGAELILDSCGCAAVPYLIAALKDSSTNIHFHHFRGSAAISLGRLKDRRAVQPLITALRDADSDVRFSAAMALGQLEDARAVEPLIAALQDPERPVREMAASSLSSLRDPRAAEPLLRALRDPAPDVRRFAAWGLGNMKAQRAVEPLIAALKDPEGLVSDAAARALGQIGDPRGVEALKAAISDGHIILDYDLDKALERIQGKEPPK
jgi:HEAT repeat protein